jgi:hypothetical protein
MPLTLSVPSKNAIGSLDIKTRLFTPNGSPTGTTVFGSWPNNFYFTLSADVGGFSAGKYTFTGHRPSDKSPCAGLGARACGTVDWPKAPGGIDPTNPPPDWEATGGPEDEDDEDED